MKHIFIDSYYSEVDFRDTFDCVDGFYEAWCEDADKFKKDVEDTYIAYQDADEIVNSLEMILEDLQKQGKIAAWQKWNCMKFDCDYGEFKE